MTVITNSKIALYFWAFLGIVSIGCQRGVSTAQRPPADSAATQGKIDSSQIIEMESSFTHEISDQWEIRSTQADGRQVLDHIYFLDETHGWTAGEDALYETADGGQNWRQLRLDLPVGATIADMSFLTRSIGWVAIQRHASISNYADNHSWVFQTIDGGKTWQQQHEDRASVVKRIVFVNQQEGWLIGHRYIGLTPLRFGLWILHTGDQGRNWKDVSEQLNESARGDTAMVNDELADILLEPPSTATLLTVRGRIFKTNDGGQSWNKIGLIPEEPEITYVCCFGVIDNHGFWLAGGAHELGKGMWGMLAREQTGSWKRYRLGSIYFKHVLLLSDGQALACGSIASDKAPPFSDKRLGVILLSSDGGENWTIVYQNKRIKTINAMVSVDSSNLWAVGEDGLILHLKL